MSAADKPTLAVIGGSRAYDLLAKGGFGKEAECVRPGTPFGKSAPVHLFEGDGFSYYFVSRHGEKGYDLSAPFVNYRANIYALKELGVQRIIAWSGPGAVNPDYKPGHFAVPHDVIDQTRRRESTFFENTGLGFIRMSEPFCPEVRGALISAEGKEGSHCHENGVYLCAEGPRLETSAEIKMFSQWGADLVGMTLVPELFLAREMEMCYAALCYVTNYAEGVKERDFRKGELFEGMLSEDERRNVESAVGLFPRVVTSALKSLASMERRTEDRKERRCNCRHAMERYRKSGKIGTDILKEVNKNRRMGGS
ncbi:MAG: MTAP family purine nucleoside phosphorylase [Nitrospinota bacterium]